jgi:hypothetical protein
VRNVAVDDLMQTAHDGSQHGTRRRLVSETMRRKGKVPAGGSSAASGLLRAT